MEEKQSIKDSVRCLRKYGSVSNYNYTKIPSHYFRHMVTENDTLQGIALKYGVTVSIFNIQLCYVIFCRYFQC